MRVRWATFPVAAVATLALTATAAFGATIMVDQDGAATPTNCAGGKPGSAYPTIQQGVDAASPGDKVKVCGEPTPYAGGVIVGTPDVHLVGVHQPVVTQSGGTAVTLAADNTGIKGFDLANSNTGLTTQPNHSGYSVLGNNIYGNTVGIFLGSDGTTQSFVMHNTIADNNAAGSASGTGIYSDVPLSNATISYNTFNNNNNEQINLAPTSGADTGIAINNNTFVNGDNTDIAFFGTVNNSRITSNHITDEASTLGSSIYIGADSNHDTLNDNRITDANYNGVAIRDTAHNIALIGNTISSPVNRGIDVSSTTAGAVTANGNRITNAGDWGIDLQAGTTGNSLAHNYVAHSHGPSGFNCVDENGSGTTNTWVGNHVAPSNPAGICT